MPRLVLLSEGFTGRSFDLKVETTTVGRVADNAFEIPESSVSSHHAEIVLRGNEVLIRDLNSTNGTFINGERITEAVLKPGQVLRLGTVEMRLDTGDASSPAAPAPPAVPPKAPPKPKQALDQTRIIPQGVKLEDLETARTPLPLEGTTGFEKKSNRGTKIFVIVIGVVIVGLIAVLVYFAMNPPQ
jgi:hypothetical protein